MNEAFLKNIRIKNYKSLANLNAGNGIDLAIPDSTNEGSGLTVLIGKNSSGKTSIASALTKLKIGSRLYDEEKNGGNDVEIIFKNNASKTLVLKTDQGGDKIIRSGDYALNYEMLDIIKDNRIWNAGFSSSSGYSYSSLRSEMDFNRSSIEASTARLLASIDESKPDEKRAINDILRKIAPDFMDWEIKGTRLSGDYIAYQLADGSKLNIDISLGSGVLNMFRIALSLISDTKIVFIDEPEAFLHPLAQIELCKILIEASKDRQIIISSHSPYMFRDAVPTGASIYIFEKVNGVTELRDTKELGKGLFGPVSPTWSEINYFAYDLPTVELHNELYGFIQAKAVAENESNYSEDGFDGYLASKGLSCDQTWIKINKNGSNSTLNRTLPTFIRNSIHHPENSLNNPYSPTQLKDSIDKLILILKGLD